MCCRSSSTAYNHWMCCWMYCRSSSTANNHWMYCWMYCRSSSTAYNHWMYCWMYCRSSSTANNHWMYCWMYCRSSSTANNHWMYCWQLEDNELQLGADLPGHWNSYNPGACLADYVSVCCLLMYCRWTDTLPSWSTDAEISCPGCRQFSAVTDHLTSDTAACMLRVLWSFVWHIWRNTGCSFTDVDAVSMLIGTLVWLLYTYTGTKQHRSVGHLPLVVI